MFFDATATTATATTRPFHELGYRWDFGDPGSGVWSTGSRPGSSSRNLANSPVAAHVYETPGTYTVTMTATDGTSTTAESCVQITVQDPEVVFSGANTRCFSNDNNFAGCPGGAQTFITSDFDNAINTNVGPGRRLLFKRGHTFTANATPTINATGPMTVGAFNTGNDPLVEISGNVSGIQLSTPQTPALSDVRIMDLEIDGNSGGTTNGVLLNGGINNVLLLRTNIHHIHTGVSGSPFLLDYFNANNNPGHALWNGLFIVDSRIANTIGGQGGNGLFLGAHRYAIMGTVMTDGTGAEHIHRTPYLYKAFIAHNEFSNPAPTKGAMKMHATKFTSAPSQQSEMIVVSNNKFTSGTNGPWTVNMGPQDDQSNELTRHVIVENNWFAPHASQQIALLIFAQSVTVRNNIFNLTGAADQRGVDVDRWGIEPTTMDVHVYNNTFYSSSSGTFLPVNFRIGSGHIAKNNLAYAPNSGSRTMVSGTGTASNNTSNANILVAPSFASATPSVPADFSLGAGSYAVNAGAAVPVFADFLGLSRSQGGAIDLGLVERP